MEENMLYWMEDLPLGYAAKLLLRVLILKEEGGNPFSESERADRCASALTTQLSFVLSTMNKLGTMTREYAQSYHILAEYEAQQLLHTTAARYTVAALAEEQSATKRHELFKQAACAATLRAVSLMLSKEYYGNDLPPAFEHLVTDSYSEAAPTLRDICESTIFAINAWLAYNRDAAYEEGVEDNVEGKMKFTVRQQLGVVVLSPLIHVLVNSLQNKEEFHWRETLEHGEFYAVFFSMYEGLILAWSYAFLVAEAAEGTFERVEESNLWMSICAWEDVAILTVYDRTPALMKAALLPVFRATETCLAVSLLTGKRIVQSLTCSAASRTKTLIDEEIIGWTLDRLQLPREFLKGVYGFFSTAQRALSSDEVVAEIDLRVSALLLKSLQYFKILIEISRLPYDSSNNVLQTATSISFFAGSMSDVLAAVLIKPDRGIEFMLDTLSSSFVAEARLPVSITGFDAAWERLAEVNQGAPHMPLRTILIRRTEALKVLQCSYVGCTQLPLGIGQKIKRKLCAGCQCVHYCSATCQKSDWKFHKQVCKLLQEL